MSATARLVIVLVFATFVAFVIYSTANLAQARCEVCIEYRGQTNCGIASGSTREEAQAGATTVACASISSGITDSIACSNTAPKSVDCQE
jgi:hypothetical protein